MQRVLYVHARRVLSIIRAWFLFYVKHVLQYVNGHAVIVLVNLFFIDFESGVKHHNLIFLSMCDLNMFSTFTSQLFYLFCSSIVINTGSDSRKLSRNERGRFGALKSDSTHHFFRNACTKSGSLRFSQFSGCRLILSVYILTSFDFPFVRLLGVG